MQIGRNRIGKLEGLLILTTLLEINPIFQAVRIVGTESVRDIAPLTYIMIFMIGSLWFSYAARIKNIPLLIGNAIKLLASCTVLVTYLIYRR